MKINYKALILIYVLLILTMSIHANLSKEFTATEQSFADGNKDAFADALATLKAKSDAEKAFLLYYTAKLDQKTSIAIETLSQLISQYPSTEYGQRGMLDRAVIHILDREIDQAQALLRRITSPKLGERIYWQAVCSFHAGDWANTIANAENYIRLEASGAHIEDCYYLVAEAYLNQNKAHSAIVTLNKLKTLKDLPKDVQYFYYKLGYAHERNRSIKDAVSQYKEGYLLDKYSQLAYSIEDRLFEMRATYGNSVDLAFLYPYVDLSIADMVVSNGQTVAQISTNTQINPPDQTVEQSLFVSGKPEGEYLIQAGRFTTKNNAENLAKRIRNLDVQAVYYESELNSQKSWVVVCGPYSTQQDAIFAHAKLREHEIDCFITRN